MSAILFPHPAMSAAQVTRVCSENNMALRQDGRGNLSLEHRYNLAANDWVEQTPGNPFAAPGRLTDSEFPQGNQ